MELFKELLLRTIIIIVVTDIVEFYVISKRNLVITPQLVFLIILVTIVPIVINVWYCLHRNGLI
jgi:hypothetical protein